MTLIKKILLPFEYAPELVTYQNVAFPLGIIQGNAKKSITPWLSSRYINCWFSPTASCNFSLYEENNWAVEEKILFQQHGSLIQNECDTIIVDSYVALFKDMIRKGYYPHGVYNEEFIPGKKAFEKRYFAHDFILCGYDDNTSCFISAGYLSNNKYQQFCIPYECMERAMITLRKDKEFYDFFRYNQEAIYEIDCDKITRDLSDYLHSIQSQPTHIQECIWGMDALIETGQFIVDLYKNENRVEHRCTCAAKEHKKLMVMRINYLLSCKFLNDQTYLDRAKDVLRLAEIAHLLGVKLFFTKEESIVHHINDIYKKIVELEKTYLPNVLLEVQSRDQYIDGH